MKGQPAHQHFKQISFQKHIKSRHKNDIVHGSKEQETLIEELNLDILNMAEKEIEWA